MNMDCEEARELVDAYALGALEVDQARQLEEHLSNCVNCRSLHFEAAEAAGSLALAVPQRRASSQLRLRLLSRVFAPKRSRGIPFRYAWAAAAAVLFAVSLGALSWGAVLQNRVSDLRAESNRLDSLVDEGTQGQVILVSTQEALNSRQREMLATLQEQDMMLAVALDDAARPYQMVGMAPLEGSYARYVWSDEHQLGVLYVVNLPAPSSGMVYQFWLLTTDGTVDGGIFMPHDDGNARLLVRDPLVIGTVVAIAVSLEPEGGSDVPSGATVLYGEPLAP